MEHPPHAKPELRQYMRTRRQALSAAAREDAALNIARHIENAPGWPSAAKIALYLAADGEIDPTVIACRLRESGKVPYLPVIQDDNSLRFAAWNPNSPLSNNRFGIPEPAGKQVLAETLDIVLLPLVAWDRAGNRLGMGGGFYDRTLAGCDNLLKVGLGFEFQQVPGIQAEPWDVRLDLIATECALHECEGKS